ncbi:hypothetical protein PQQ81_08860 [Paraburkholderia strydomiana]|uniref:hypothetical protein n=1 Tax=Paraburkholderia strydomiana TaxID=1245417 RepID=UPI0038BD414C
MPQEVITFEEVAQWLFLARPHIAKLIADGVLTATDGMLNKSDVLEYKSKQRAAAKTFLSGQTGGYWSTDDRPAGGPEPPKS